MKNRSYVLNKFLYKNKEIIEKKIELCQRKK